MAGLLGSAARVGVAAWGRAGCRPRGVTAPTTGSPAAAPMLGRPAPARCPVLGRCPSPGPNAGSMASSATWSPRGTKVPGQNPLGTAIQGPEWARRSLARAAALRRARAPRRREGRFVYRERKPEDESLCGMCIRITIRLYFSGTLPPGTGKKYGLYENLAVPKSGQKVWLGYNMCAPVTAGTSVTPE